MALNLVKNKEHLTTEGLRKIVGIKASINNGLSDSLKAAFSNILPVKRPCVLGCKITNPNWLAGFASGEGCFHVSIYQASSGLRFKITARFQLTQHTRDEQLIKSLIEYLDCGKIYIKRETVDFVVTKRSDLIGKIFPFFSKYPIQGVKYQDFEDFVKVVSLLEQKSHLTQTGLDQIREIKSGMNRGRIE